MLSEVEIIDVEARAEMVSDSKDEALKLRYAEKAAKEDVPNLIETIRAYAAGQGGGAGFGLWLREALATRLDGALIQSGLRSEEQRIAKFADDIRVHSITVSSVAGEGRVWLDVRLAIGDPPRKGA